MPVLNWLNHVTALGQCVSGHAAEYYRYFAPSTQSAPGGHRTVKTTWEIITTERCCGYYQRVHGRHWHLFVFVSRGLIWQPTKRTKKKENWVRRIDRGWLLSGKSVGFNNNLGRILLGRWFGRWVDNQSWMSWDVTQWPYRFVLHWFQLLQAL